MRLRVTIHAPVTESPAGDTAGATGIKRGDGTRIVATGGAGALTGGLIDATDRSILTLLVSGGEHGTGEVAAAIGLSARATRTRLVKLVSLGLVREVGMGPNDPKRRYIASRAVLGGG